MEGHPATPLQSRARPATQVERVRGTQSLVTVLARCWSRPGLIARELAWRWLFGIPALVLLLSNGRHLLNLLHTAHVPLDDLSPLDPPRTAGFLAVAWSVTVPTLRSSALWLAPLLVLGWAAASGVGRAFVLRRLAPHARFRPGSLVLLQLLRILGLLCTVSLWLLLVRWAATGTILDRPAGAEPHTVGFAAWLICLSLGSFTAWAACSWVLSIAAVLIVVEGRSVGESLTAAFRLGRLIPKLVEVNLVLGIVKLALIVLALVFSSIPLPFETVMSGLALYVWWAAVGVAYLAASDFFQVVRLAAFLELHGMKPR